MLFGDGVFLLGAYYSAMIDNSRKRDGQEINTDNTPFNKHQLGAVARLGTTKKGLGVGVYMKTSFMKMIEEVDGKLFQFGAGFRWNFK